MELFICQSLNWHLYPITPLEIIENLSLELKDVNLVKNSCDFSTHSWLNYELRMQGEAMMAFASISCVKPVKELPVNQMNLNQDNVRLARENLLQHLAQGLQDTSESSSGASQES